MKRFTSIAAGLVALTLVAAACGSDDSDSSDTTAASTETTAGSTETTAASTETTAGSTETTAGGAATTGAPAGDPMELDTNGDGKYLIGIATPGPRNDGAYYQALVDGLTTWSADNGFEEPIVVDNIKPEEAQTSLDSLARQGVDIIAVGAGEIADPLPELTETYGDVIWYCNCGGGFEELPNLIQQGDDGSEISYTAGVATALLLQESGGTQAAMIGNNNFNFEKETFGGFRIGLDEIDPSFEWTYVATGSFNDVAAATEAFNNLKDAGVNAIYPYLGGSHEAVVKLSNENDIITMSAGAANACERTDLDYQIAVKFDSGLYAISIFNKMLSGEVQRGDTYVFHVGVDPEVGAVICDPTPEQEAAMEDAFARVAAGELTEQFDANRGGVRRLSEVVGGVAVPAATPPDPAAAVVLQGITKRYGSVVACSEVDLALRTGRIHGVLGENGAGKSTLMKVLIGLIQPDEGRIVVHGDEVTIHDPVSAADLGIAMVHQHYSLVEPLTVWENVVLGERVRLDRNRACERVAALSDRYGLGVDPLALVSTLTAGQRQRVEIIKCLRREPRIIVFDEPTSVLTPAESEQLFATLRTAVVEEQRAVALVSHKLDEILHATDEVTIMRGGKVVDRMVTTDATASALAQAMVGRPVSLRSEAAALGLIDTLADAANRDDTDGVAAKAPVVLEVRNAVVTGADGHRFLDDLSITVRAGEIVGLAGVEGNGQRQLADVLSSLIHLDDGEVLVSGQPVRTDKPGSLGRVGVAVIPEDRHDSGCVLDMSVAENLSMVDLPTVSRRGVMDRDEMEQRAKRLMQEFGITARSPHAPMRSLSGGNQQRVVLAREMSTDPIVLVAAQPTRGLDVGAIEYMTERLKAAAASGVGILLISTELEEVLSLAHRICVIHDGKVVGEMMHHETDLERLGMLLGGMAA